MLPYCLDSGVGVIPWSPLARGVLARGRSLESTRSNTDGLMHRLSAEEDFQVAEAVAAVAEKREVPPAQVALAWLLSRPAVTAPIIGASRTGHIDDAVAAVELRLTDAEIAELEAPYRPHAVIGHH